MCGGRSPESAKPPSRCSGTRPADGRCQRRGSMMQPRFTLVIFRRCPHLARARAFYEAWGWNASSARKPTEVAFFQANGLALALWRADSWRRMPALQTSQRALQLCRWPITRVRRKRPTRCMRRRSLRAPERRSLCTTSSGAVTRAISRIPTNISGGRVESRVPSR